MGVNHSTAPATLPLCSAALLVGSGASLTREPFVSLVGNLIWKYCPFSVSANCYSGMPVQHMWIVAFWSEYRLYNRETTAALGSSGFRGKAWYNQLTGMFFSVKRRSLGTWSRDKRTDDGDTREMQGASCCLSTVWGKCWIIATTSWYLWGHTGLSLQVQLCLGDLGREGEGWLLCGCSPWPDVGMGCLGLKMPWRRLTPEPSNSLHWP